MYYALTENMKALYLSKQRQTVNINVELKDGSDADDFVITEADILSGSFSIDRYCATGENLEIGSAVASEVKFDIDNSSRKFDNVQLGGAKLFVRLGIKDYSNPESNTEFIDCGYFTVDENPKPLAVISVAALDNMMRFDKAVNWDNFTFPMKLEAALNVCCTDCAVTLSPSVSFDALPNGDYEITQAPSTKDITYRTLVQWIAEIIGTCAYADWNGHLCLSWCKNTDIEITPSIRYSSVVEDAITVTGVQITESEEDKYLCGEEGFVFNIEGNELIQHDKSTVAENLGAVLCGFTYVPFECSCFPMPYIYPLDIVSFTDAKGNTFNTVITAHVYSLNGTSSLKASGENQQQSGYATSSPFTKREAVIIKKIQNEQKQLKKTEQTTFDLNKSLSYALGLFSSTVKHEDGSETQYLHSKENIADCVEGDIIFCLNAGGFGVCTTGWNDGEPVFDNGFDAKSGAALWRYLSAHKISADLIEAGRITSVDGSTFFDLDAGSFGTQVGDDEDIKYLFQQDAGQGVFLMTENVMTYQEYVDNLTENEADELNSIKSAAEAYYNFYIGLGFSEESAQKAKKQLMTTLAAAVWRVKCKGFFVQSQKEETGYIYYFSGNKAVFSKGDDIEHLDSTEFSADGIKSNQRLKIDAPGIDLPWVVLPSGTDFNTVLTPNLYIGEVTLGDGTNSNYTNSPDVRKASFKFVVQPEGNKEQLLQRLTLCSKGDSRTWERHYHSGSWGEWTCVYSEGNTLLASPNWVMSATQTVTLSEPISKQPTGIVLVFSRYENGAVDDNFHTFFISKKEVALFPGCGHSFTLFRGAGNVFNGASVKYLYIDDTTIRGHAANDDTSGMGSCGVSYNNSIFVLRRVIGV